MATIKMILDVAMVICLILGVLFLALGLYELFRTSYLAEDIQAYKEKKRAKRQQSADAHPRGD